MRARDRIEYDNSFDVGTNFSLRGNSSSLNHAYEYFKTFNRTPLHHINSLFTSTPNEDVFGKLMTGIRENYPNSEVITRKSLDVTVTSANQPPEDTYSSVQLIRVEGTGISILCRFVFDNHITIEMCLSNDKEYEICEGIIKTMIETFQPEKIESIDRFFMIVHNGQCFELVNYDVNFEKFKNFNIDLLYNEDFKEVSEYIKKTLSSEKGETGIVLLHGIPGSGKTTYIRHLISSINKRIIYMSPDMASRLGDPTFFNFIRQYPNSILVIEDGENILRKRSEDDRNSTAISNLLNMSDGIVGDALGIQVVCTFNADLSEIDEALLRPGRLIANHYFGKLSKEKTLNLVKYVHGEDAEPSSPEMTVDEVYTMNKPFYSNEKSRKPYKIGFLTG